MYRIIDENECTMEHVQLVFFCWRQDFTYLGN